MRNLKNQIVKLCSLGVVVTVFLMQGMAHAEDQSIDFGLQKNQQDAQEALDTVKTLSKEIQALKSTVVDLNKDLQLMEEQLLFPSSTRVTIFLSLDIGQFFKLESVKLKLDGKQVATHLYSDKQRQSLARGGVQNLYLTNLNVGKHNVSAFFTGVGPNGRPYKRVAELDFVKNKGSQYLELAIVDDLKKQAPIFEIKQW